MWDWLDNEAPYRQTTVEVIPLGTDRELVVKLRENMSLLRPTSIPRTWAAEHVCRVSERLRQQEAVR